MSPAEARVKEVPSGMTEAEWTQRINLAACYRLVALYGWDDLVDTHISARVPGPEHQFLINPYGLMFDEITSREVSRRRKMPSNWLRLWARRSRKLPRLFSSRVSEMPRMRRHSSSSRR